MSSADRARTRPPSGVGPHARPVPRGLALVSLTALLSALGHLAGGGTLPDLGLLLVLLPLLALVVTSLAERIRGRFAVLGTLGAGQLVLHELLVLFGHDHAGPVDAPRMLAMHAVATVLSGLLLAHVDALLAAVGHALRRVVPRRPGTPVVTPRVRTWVTPEASSGHVRRAAVGALGLRGPPVASAP
ncbi:hypothetical protein [Pseudonocardia oroxyli]|uniref:Uncharacterized protein n=1 Tax=Pseudonocardia oroxyli TaxID=366584 RepID=A0A1G7LYT9_PSEOR|nr:hypothetical protein [Pseudonocardia oroxyli]SDF54613.1 hypothetical protein SAMN05216377_105216 [Pseudonocardia oroxyli]